ncbi:hypothetical protein [Erwinia sp. S59]|uniref:hypothetical protein n=1 Tax=Erwinia sp. S59 TaxID=2769340 RepID=UPI002572AE06|nr:hypothetical protein [Erwinia sp. S59]
MMKIAKPDMSNMTFWESALELPFLAWAFLLFFRLAWFKGQSNSAINSDRLREKKLNREIQRGQRCLNVYGLSLHTAFRTDIDTQGNLQWDALNQKKAALKTQPSWLGSRGVRHSRIIRNNPEAVEQLLKRGFAKVLGELSPKLAMMSEETSIAVLLESESHLNSHQIESIFKQCWQDSGIAQPVTRISGAGLAVIDQWLDQRSNETTMLLVLAAQVEPEHPEGTSEAIVGLLLGHSLHMPNLPAIARLHRPEQSYHTDVEDLEYAIAHALKWVPTKGESIESGWLVGIHPECNIAVATALKAVKSPINIGQDLINLDAILGYPGCSAPWVAVACATQFCSNGKAQLILSGNRVNAPLWATMITPEELSTQLR